MRICCFEGFSSFSPKKVFAQCLFSLIDRIRALFEIIRSCFVKGSRETFSRPTELVRTPVEQSASERILKDLPNRSKNESPGLSSDESEDDETRQKRAEISKGKKKWVDEPAPPLLPLSSSESFASLKDSSPGQTPRSATPFTEKTDEALLI